MFFIEAEQLVQLDCYALPSAPVCVKNVPHDLQQRVVDILRASFGADAQLFVEDSCTDWQKFVPIERQVDIKVAPQRLEKKQNFDWQDLLRIMDILMGEHGCEWDKVQTHESIRQNTLEEAYEVVDAIDLGDNAKLQEELGDLLLQAVFHAKIAQKDDRFDYKNVLSTLCYKLVFRHTHIFGQDKATDSAQALSFWEQAKSQEKNQKTVQDKLADMPKGFPATIRAPKILKLYKKSGHALPQVEASTLLQDFLQQPSVQSLGQLLLHICNIAYDCNLDCEQALKKELQKLEQVLQST